MKTNPLISVIVPVYNVEKYLTKCVDSITNQTYKNLEIILVDDGSPDNCPILCDNFAKTDKRIKVIHKKNGGLSDARNVGIENATGEYITFVDSDDYLNNNLIKLLYDNMIQTNSNISICSFQEVRENDNLDISAKQDAELEVFSDSSIMDQLYSKHHVEFVTAWGKLYKKDIFKHVKYPIGKINEDEFVCHHILSLCNKVCYTDAKCYYYLQRENSIMHQKYSKKNLDVFEAFYDRFVFFKEKYPNLAVLALYDFLSNIISRYYKFDKKYRKFLRKMFNKNYNKINNFYLKQLSKKRKIKLFLFKYFRIFYKFYNK